MKLKKIKDGVLKGITVIASLVLILCMGSIDSENWIPVAVAMILSMAWLTPMAIANNWAGR